MSRASCKWLIASGGFLLGLALLGVALRGIDGAQVMVAWRTLRVELLVASCAVYWIGMGLRGERWRAMLGQFGTVTPREVLVTLVIGYGANTLLPARLGEFVRADEARRRFGFRRSLVLGSILGERVLDLLVVIFLLLGGGAWLALTGAAVLPAIFGNLALNAALVGCALAVGVALLPRLLRTTSFAFGARVSRDLAQGLGSLGGLRTTAALGLTLAIWFSEALALWLLVAAFDVTLSPAELCLLVAVSSLSTLVPGAPGYVGAYQLAYVLVFETFGLTPAVGLLAATATQLFLFGSVALVSVVLYIMRAVRSPMRVPMALDATPVDNATHA